MYSIFSWGLWNKPSVDSLFIEFYTNIKMTVWEGYICTTDMVTPYMMMLKNNLNQCANNMNLPNHIKIACPHNKWSSINMSPLIPLPARVGRCFTTPGKLPFDNIPIPRWAKKHRVIRVPTTVSNRWFMMLECCNLGSTHLQTITKLPSINLIVQS